MSDLPMRRRVLRVLAAAVATTFETPAPAYCR